MIEASTLLEYGNGVDETFSASHSSFPFSGLSFSSSHGRWSSSNVPPPSPHDRCTVLYVDTGKEGPSFRPSCIRALEEGEVPSPPPAVSSFHGALHLSD